MKIVLIIVLLLAMGGGLYLASMIFKGQKPELSAAGIHGIVALVLLALVGYLAYSWHETKLWIALGVMIMASGGGLYLVGNHKKGEPGPKSAVVIHAIFAIIGITFCILSII